MPRKVILLASGIATEPSADLEDLFPGRWNPQREIHPEVAILLEAVARAVESAGWWQRTSGRGIAGGQVIGTDVQCVESALRFGGTLRSDWRNVFPSDYLFSLPSSAAAMVGVAFGLEEYQGTLTGHGHSGYQAIRHAVDLLELGRIARVVVGALTVVGPGTLKILQRLGLARSNDGPYALAVAGCLGTGDREKMPEAVVIEPGTVQNPAATGPRRGGEPDRPTLETGELLDDVPPSYRTLAAPSLLALCRVAEGLVEGSNTRCTVVHRDLCTRTRMAVTLSAARREWRSPARG